VVSLPIPNTRPVPAVLTLSFILLLAVVFVTVSGPPAWAQGSQDAVLREILDILRRNGHITEEQHRSLVERAKSGEGKNAAES